MILTPLKVDQGKEREIQKTKMCALLKRESHHIPSFLHTFEKVCCWLRWAGKASNSALFIWSWVKHALEIAFRELKQYSADAGQKKKSISGMLSFGPRMLMIYNSNFVKKYYFISCTHNYQNHIEFWRKIITLFSKMLSWNGWQQLTTVSTIRNSL